MTGPGQYSLFFHVNRTRGGVLGSGTAECKFTIPDDVDGAHAALAVVMADMADHIAELIGILPMEREPAAASDEPEPGIPTGPNGEFPPDIELIYQAFRARSEKERGAINASTGPKD